MRVLDTEDWDKVPLEVYEKTYIEVKELFDDILTEVTSVTDKSIKMLTLFGLFILSAGSVISSQPSFMCVDILLYTLSAANIMLICLTIKGRKQYHRGLHSNNLIAKEQFSRWTRKSMKMKIYYFTAIEKYEFKIAEMTAFNSGRAKKYNSNLWVTVGLIVIISTYCAVLADLN